MDTFIIVASIVIVLAVGVLLAIALVGQSKKTREAIAATEIGEETETEDCTAENSECENNENEESANN